VFHIPISQVRSVVNTGSLQREPKDKGNRVYHPKFEGQAQSFQEQMAGDKELTKLMMILMNDPEYRDTLQDPEILKAIRTGELEKLQANPKMNRLTKNPKFLEIYKRIP
jgi:hypothetical protein